MLNRLEREGFAPAIDADPVTLRRRLAFDLTGLPPTGLAESLSYDGPWALAEQDKERLRMDIVDHQINLVGRTFLGVTLDYAAHQLAFTSLNDTTPLVIEPSRPDSNTRPPPWCRAVCMAIYILVEVPDCSDDFERQSGSDFAWNTSGHNAPNSVNAYKKD